MDPTEPDIAPPRPSIAQLFTRLVDEGEGFIRAEVSLYRAQAGRKALSAGTVAGLFGAALLLAQAAAVALLIGLLIALIPAVGFVWATLIVVVGTAIVVAILIRLGLSRLNAMLKPDEGE